MHEIEKPIHTTCLDLMHKFLWGIFGIPKIYLNSNWELSPSIVAQCKRRPNNIYDIIWLIAWMQKESNLFDIRLDSKILIIQKYMNH